MKKELWKVTVNKFGWYKPQTYYLDNRDDAYALYHHADAADRVRHITVNADNITYDIDEAAYNDRLYYVSTGTLRDIY